MKTKIFTALILATLAATTHAQSTFNKYQPANGVQCNTGLTYIDTACAASAIPAAGSTTQMIYNLAGVYTGNAQATVAADLGLVVGAATGGSKGPGTLNATALYINGAAVGTSSGAVSSVGLADGSTSPIYTITGSPVTAAGTLTETLMTQTANKVFASAISGGAAQPAFRALVVADIPTLNQNTTGNAATATASDHAPTQCTSGQYSTGVTTVWAANCAQVAYSQISGTPTIPTAANPSGLIGMSAVNGSAAAFERSDATHAIDPAIGPTWTGTHFFTGTVGRSTSVLSASVGLDGGIYPAFTWNQPSNGTNSKIWETYADSSNTWHLSLINDSLTAARDAVSFLRSGIATTNITLGNTTDLPGITVDGNMTISPVAATAALAASATNSVVASFTGGNTSTGGILSVTDGHTGAQAFQFGVGITTASHYQIYDATNGVTRFDVASGGDVSIAAPSGHPFAVCTLVACGTVLFQVQASGSVGMPFLGTSTLAQTGYLCWSSSGGALTVDSTNTCLVSSIRYKKNVKPLEFGLDAVMKLRPITYEYKDGFMPDKFNPGRQDGFIAEEVQKVDPRLTPLDSEGKPKSVEYAQMSALLVRAIQDQQQEIWELKLALGALAVVTLTWLSALTWKRRRGH